MHNLINTWFLESWVFNKISNNFSPVDFVPGLIFQKFWRIHHWNKALLSEYLPLSRQARKIKFGGGGKYEKWRNSYEKKEKTSWQKLTVNGGGDAFFRGGEELRFETTVDNLLILNILLMSDSKKAEIHFSYLHSGSISFFWSWFGSAFHP